MRIFAVIIFLACLIFLYFAMNDRKRCPNPDDVWVLSENNWVCVKPTYVP